MRIAEVYRDGVFAGVLSEESRNSYVFKYDETYLSNVNQALISLTLPKTKQEYRSDYLFPFFFNMLSEGVNRKLQSRQLKIDEKDYFGLLLATANYDTIGAVTIKPVKEKQ
ncbi:MAG: HipA N-terminal domain-containing protein [Candidatus Marinimicrobia bacterium]|nr:HipA N-terminal domain-containing protein [Candidatus Neomarinimicrobiota bacterium]